MSRNVRIAHQLAKIASLSKIFIAKEPVPHEEAVKAHSEMIAIVDGAMVLLLDGITKDPSLKSSGGTTL